MKVAVVTIVSGRHDHLNRQYLGLLASTVKPVHYVVVAMDDPELAVWRPSGSPCPDLVPLSVPGDGLPLAAARNLGAHRAIEGGSDLLVFLDVDCIPSSTMIARYAEAADATPHALLSGAVGYLPEGTVEHAEPELFASVARFHSFRPRLVAGESARADPRLFWSLSFACSPSTYTAIGGFDEGYRGYGAEDTDFGMRAVVAEIDLFWVGGAEAFHQHHPTNDPPTRHLDAVLRNGRYFNSRWGFWPMEGWLNKFAGLGLVARNPVTGDWARVGMEA